MRRAALWTVVIAALLIFGAARLPFEKSLEAAHREAGLRSAALNIELREQIGQLAYAAALSGFRSLVAAFLWIEAHSAWEQTAWGRMAGLFQSVTGLQPRSLVYWDLASWHMAWNASIAARDNPKEPSEFLRRRAEREYHEIGRDFLQRGIDNKEANAALIIDGQKVFDLTHEHIVEIRKCEYEHLMIREVSHNFFHLLREKLKFGSRN
jgi:hypothetical protein